MGYIRAKRKKIWDFRTKIVNPNARNPFKRADCQGNGLRHKCDKNGKAITRG